MSTQSSNQTLQLQGCSLGFLPDLKQNKKALFRGIAVSFTFLFLFLRLWSFSKGSEG